MITVAELAAMVLRDAGYPDSRIDKQGNNFFVYLDKETQLGEFNPSAGFDPSMNDFVYFRAKELELAAKLTCLLCPDTPNQAPEPS